MFVHRYTPGLDEGRFEDGGRRAERPIVVVNPTGDPEFRAQIDSILASGAWRPEMLEARLRARYPNVVVRPRALAGERAEVWYVYRDGHWIRSERDAGT